MEFQKDVRSRKSFTRASKSIFSPRPVYVFTPKATIKAFALRCDRRRLCIRIHSEVGHHCAGARISGAIAPLRQKLKNGDVVDITTRADQNRAKIGSGR
ncbi:MAG: TGS domain-containing protein [Polyangiales bacterium]